MINNIRSFLTLIIGNALIIVLLGLDLLGACLTYTGIVSVPGWVLAGLPLIGVSIASFRYFLKHQQSVVIRFNEEKLYDFQSVHQEGSSSRSFYTSIRGYITNKGELAVSLDKVLCSSFSMNELKDPFIINKLKVSISVSKLLKISNSEKMNESILLPLILPSNTLIPFELKLTISIKEPNENDHVLQWLRYIGFRFNYTLVDSNGETNHSIVLKMSVNKWKGLKEVATALG